MNKLDMALRILACPDCSGALNAELVCPSCQRSLAPQEDGIISALPAAMEGERQDKDQLQQAIDVSAPEQHSDQIVLYEKAFHDEQASYYDSLFTDPLPLAKYYDCLIRRQVFSFVDREPFVVDLCCGTGKSSLPLIEQGRFVVGIDVSREMLRSYRKKCAARGYENSLFIQADATRPPLRPSSCGAMIVIGGLHHIARRAECMEHWCEALRHDGILVLHEPLKTGKTSRVAVCLENLYAVTDPGRVWRAIRRRMGLRNGTDGPPPAEAEIHDFTPYERPFASAEELLAVMPSRMQSVVLRSQGLLSFREFSAPLQGRAGQPLAALIVRLDNWFSENGHMNWSGDTLFAVFRKSSA